MNASLIKPRRPRVQWFAETPTSPGWYWWVVGDRVHAIELSKYKGELVSNTGGKSHWKVSLLKGAFSGPFINRPMGPTPEPPGPGEL